ncbi:MAG TPA: ribonuclease D [Alteromonas sp.]|nr:ribonuclease D [Alteromonadaceae bacterium]MAX44920.1 ribonuclease D [Alteromonadaceae bacterium]HBY38535.1 ribonuclease D [Alteromonas sp.]|tara:strand:+ start:9086 stop:10228 length:1143 start_codon:yes stop_codon:yes gene_type:complete
MDYIFIQDQETLDLVCARAARHKAIAIDTEFVRTRTLAPALGLVQLFDGHQLALIDPLAIDDLSSLTSLLVNPDVIKVLHSCSEDLEAFLATFSLVPRPIFDTQFAAGLLGLGTTMGYGRMIEMLLEITLEKGESRTDWLARPLSDNQCRYAADDVLYLLPAFEQLYDMVEARGKLDWVLSESASLSEKKKATMPAEYAYLQIKNAWKLSSQQLTVLKHLAAWRLTRAQQKDMALNFVFKEAHLFELALRMPQSKGALSRIHCLTPQERRLRPEILLDIIRQGLEEFDNTSSEAHIPRIKRLIDFPHYKQTLARLKHAAAEIAVEQGVSEEVIASKKQLNQLIKWHWFDIDECRVQGLKPDVLTGWRATYFEPVAQAVFN